MGEANRKFFEGRDALVFGYEDDTMTGNHFLVRKPSFPALIAKLETKPGGLFQITLSEKSDPQHYDYQKVQRAELNVVLNAEGTPRLSHQGRTIGMSSAAGVMLSPLVKRALGLK